MHHLGVASQSAGTNPVRLLAHAVQNVTGCINNTTTGGVRNSLQHNQIAKTLQ